MDINKELELYQFEKINQTLFRNHPDAIYILDLEGNFTLVNEEVCRITGLKRELLIGNSFKFLIHPDQLEFTINKFLLVLSDQPQRYETTIATEHGVIYLDVTNFPLKTVDNKIFAVFGIAKDITEKKQKELELQAYAELLEAQNEELELFRKIIAHDMRKPVANAIGLAKLLEGGMLPAEKEQEIKQLLLKTVESADAMVRDLNEVIALKSRGMEPKEQINVEEVLVSILAFFKNYIKSLNAAVTLSVEPGLKVFTVKAYFDSILGNLISNALKYHSRQAVPTVSITAAASGSRVEVSIKDGIGMDMAGVSGELFKMHKRFAPSLAEGNGFGLYIVDQQVKLLGGSIEVKSELGQGSNLRFIYHLANA